MDEQEIYGVIGDDGFRRLVAAFYRRVPADEILGPMYQKDLNGAETRLREFLIFRFGGPSTYVETRGHPRLRMRHAPFPVGEAARNRWMELMDAALEETQFPADVTDALHRYFADTATFLMNRLERPS